MAQRGHGNTVRSIRNPSQRVVGNTALKEARRFEQAPAQKPSAPVRVMPRRAPKQRAQFSPAARAALLFMAALILAMGVLLVGRLAVISANNTRIQQQEEALAALQRESDQLEIQLASSEDVTQIMSEATQLGMGTPAESQIVAIALDSDAETGTEIADSDTQEENGFMAMLSKLAGLLN